MKNWEIIQAGVTPFLNDFRAGLQNPVLLQEKNLKQILSANQTTVFGQKYKFSTIQNYSEFCASVPIQTYDDFAPYIQQMAAGGNSILTAEPVLAFELTGGSTQGAKLIPYTSTGLAAFRQAIFPWLADLLQHRPGVQRGRSYWAISPVTRSLTQTTAGIPIGLPSDAAYFGERLAPLLVELLAVPPEFAAIQSIEEWRFLTALFLLAAEDLCLISVWSPTFLLQLVEMMEQACDRILKALNDGWGNLPANPARARAIATAFSGAGLDTTQIWPQLDTISCWTDATAKAFISRLKRHFPHAFIQGKGLLATEGVVSLPLSDCPAPVLAVQSGFYEFLDADEQPCLCDRVVQDRIYRVVTTTASGLYRYDTGDLVRVRGWVAQTPLLEFVGRAGLTSDLCGEKLTEAFVLQQLGNKPGFAMLAPSFQGTPHYVLFLDAAVDDDAAAIALCQTLENALKANPQYQYARRLGQLGALVVHRVQNPMQRYCDRALQRGQRLGDIKPPALSRERDWESFFSVPGC